MRLNIGSIARWNGAAAALVSPDYVVFRCQKDRLDSDFLDHYRRSHAWEEFVRNEGSGSVRVRIYFHHLGRLRLKMPSLDEQRAIASMLNACDLQISLLRRRLAALQQQKRGLMQKLLTGTVRVHVGS